MTVRLFFGTQGVRPAAEASGRSQREYRLRLWARSSPPGAAITVFQNTEVIDTEVKSEIADGTESIVGVDWTQVEASVVLGANVSVTVPIFIGMRAPSHLGGTVYIDDVELV